MGTSVQRFYPATTNWDGTDPTGGDVRALDTALPAANVTSTVNFGSSGAKTITVDPYTGGRTTTGVDSAFGWAIDILGADGMDSTATAKRFIPAGVWYFQGTLSTLVVPLNNVTVGINVYRVAASPSTTRTLIFSANATSILPTAAGANWSITTASQAKILLEANETLQVTYTLAGTGQIGDLFINFDTGDHAAGFDCWVDVVTPGVRTEHLLTRVAPATPAAALNRRLVRKTAIKATSTPAAVLVRRMAKVPRTAPATPSALLRKRQVNKTLLRAAVTPTALVRRRVKVSVLRATATPVAFLVRRRPSLTIRATTTPVALLVRRNVRKAVIRATVTPNALARKQVRTSLLRATVTPTALLNRRRVLKTIRATVTPNAILSKRQVRLATIRATVTPTALVRKTVKKTLFRATATPVALIRKTVEKPLTASVTPAAILVQRRVSKTIRATVTPAAQPVKISYVIRRTATVIAVGLLRRTVRKAPIRADVTPTALIRKTAKTTKIATVTPVAKGRIEVPLNRFPTGGGGTTIVKKPLFPVYD